MTPFLFLIVVEGLTGMASMTINKNLYERAKIGGNNVEVSLLQFTDNTLFICESHYWSILVIKKKSILRSFDLLSNLRVNFH